MPNLRGKTWTTTTPANVGDAQFWEDHMMSDLDHSMIQSAVQSVNNITPDFDGNVTISTVPPGGRKGQSLVKFSNTSGDAGWGDAGHVIEDLHSIEQPQQPVLQFLGADVSNDPVNKKTIVDCHGEKGDPGKSAYSYAVDGGYTGTEAQFTTDLGQFQELATTAENAAADAEDCVDEVRSLLSVPSFEVDFTTGDLMYDNETRYSFLIDDTNGDLMWEVLP